MAEYIERTEALEITTRTCGDYAAAWSEIRKLPAADVAPVVHGRWVDDEPNLTHGCYRHSAHYQCSVCGRRTGKTQTRSYRYCPKCGARMDGEADGSD